MAQSVNKIRNPDFTGGTPEPRGWCWTTTSKSLRTERKKPDPSDGTRGVTIHSRRTTGTACWSQVVACKPEKFYRVELTGTCELTTDVEGRVRSGCGLFLSVQPIEDDEPAGAKRITPGVLRSSAPVAVRAVFQAPEGVRRVRLSVGVSKARGTACVHHVRFIEILEPEDVSHPLAIPGPAHTELPPHEARTVCICSAVADRRPITQRLRDCFGETAVETITPRGFRLAGLVADALLLPDSTPPPAIRSLKTLMKLASDHIVVVSLPAMVKLSGGKLSLRRIEQDDDPVHAKVVFANYATRGFALGDVFPYGWPGKTIGSFVQNQYRRTGALKSFCDRNGLTALLWSVCDQDVTSDRPICLFTETGRGGLFVLDIEPAEADCSTLGETTLAMHLLLSVLGKAQNSLGQYTVPERTESDFRQSIREMPDRFDPVEVWSEDLPVEEVKEQLVTIGREDRTYGMPLKPKPVILVRSGLVSGDALSDYGALLWFKQFVRSGPHTCPYAARLASRFRLAWVPCVAGWEPHDGWQRGAHPPNHPMTIEMEDSEVAAVIDIASSDSNEVGIVLPTIEGDYRRYVEWLPRLFSTFAPGQYFALTPDDGEGFADRDRFRWRHVEHGMGFIVDPEAFNSEIHRAVTSFGGCVIRIEIPDHDADFMAASIQRTDIAATLLEHVIGMQYGLIAVNRHTSPIHFDGLPPVAPGKTLIVDRDDTLLRVDASQAG